MTNRYWLFICCLHRFFNFGNVISLQKLEEDDITKIEQMVKTQLIDFLAGNEESNNFIEYFGPIYHSKPDQFTFTCGDRKMLKQLSDYVQTTVQKKRLCIFSG